MRVAAQPSTSPVRSATQRACAAVPLRSGCMFGSLQVITSGGPVNWPSSRCTSLPQNFETPLQVMLEERH